jgi:hypothetical protein
MRRTYISPEFDHLRVNGTFNMLEESTFFGSKMLEIEDIISIENQSLVYFESVSKEQIDITVESLLQPVSYSTSEDKFLNHRLRIDESQSNQQKETTTRYILEIDLEAILTNFIFATLKRWRTFEGVRNNMTKDNDVNFAIRDYIIKNVLDRYRLTKIDLYLNYVSIQNRNSLKFNNIWAGKTDTLTGRSSIIPDDIISEQFNLKKFTVETEFDYSKSTITFNQEKKSNEFCFDYFFNIYYQKI